MDNTLSMPLFYDSCNTEVVGSILAELTQRVPHFRYEQRDGQDFLEVSRAIEALRVTDIACFWSQDGVRFYISGFAGEMKANIVVIPRSQFDEDGLLAIVSAIGFGEEGHRSFTFCNSNISRL